MRVCLAGTLVVWLSACAGPTLEATPCDLLHPRDAARFIGAEVRQTLPTGTGDGCSFGNPNIDETTLLIHVSPDSAREFAADRELASHSAEIRALSIGDEAFAYGNPETRIESAEARVGEKRFRVVIEGPQPTADGATAALTTLVDRA